MGHVGACAFGFNGARTKFADPLAWDVVSSKRASFFALGFYRIASSGSRLLDLHQEVSIALSCDELFRLQRRNHREPLAGR